MCIYGFDIERTETYSMYNNHNVAHTVYYILFWAEFSVSFVHSIL